MSVKIEKVSYKGFKDCIRLSNDTVDLIVTTKVGPRVLRYGLLDQENEFCNVKDHMNGKYDKKEWNIFGGHRLWHSPETKPRTYMPDNSPIDFQISDNSVVLSQPVEQWVNIKKDITITLEDTGSKVSVFHKLTNKGAWDVELALWAITVMATGGKEIVPQCQTDTGLLPNRMISLWPYTKLNDHRINWGEKYIILQQDPNTEPAFKFGISNHEGWAAYANHGHLFVKRFDTVDNALYPDYSASTYETYTTDFMLEMESLSPMVKLKVDQELTHEERWSLYDNVNVPETEKDVDQSIIPLIKSSK